jgi:hypothetical protein
MRLPGGNTGWFDVRNYGAKGNAVFDLTSGTWTGTDDGPAILATINAAIASDQTFGNRFGTVYFSPCAPGRAYLISSEVAVQLSQAGLTSGSALHLRLLGCGADSMIVVGVTDNTKYGIAIDVQGMEWFQGVAENLAFCSADFKNSSGHAMCKSALRLGATVGRWVVRDIHFLALWANFALLHLANGNFSVSNIEDAGSSSGHDTLGFAGFIYLDQPQVARVDGVFSYGEVNYLGFDLGITPGSGLGLHSALVAVNANTDSGWGPSVVEVTNIHGTTRDGTLLYCYPITGTARVASLKLSNFKTQSSSDGGCIAAYVDSLIIENGSWYAGAPYFLLDAYDVGRAVVRNIKTMTGATLPKVRADSAVVTLEIDNVPLGTLTSLATQTIVDSGGGRQIPRYTNASRPAAAALTFSPIFNTDLGSIQISDGTNWITLAAEAP